MRFLNIQFENMNNLSRRFLILFVFAIIFAGVLLATDMIFSHHQEQVSSEPIAPAVVQAPARNPAFSLPPAPAAQPPPEKPVEEEKKSVPPSAKATEPKEEAIDLREMFASGQPIEEVPVDPEQVKQMLRDYVERNHPSLKLSDREYERLATAMGTFRVANLRMRSLERTSANAPAIRESLQEMATAMQDFQQITGMTQGEFFTGAGAPVQFGGDEEPKNDETVVDFLPDPHP